MKTTLSLIGAMIGAILSQAAQATPPANINVHGQLIGSGGDAISGDRAYQVTFYDAATDGNVLGSALTGTVTVSDSGLFNLAVTPPAEVLTANGVWYSVGVDTDVPADSDASDDVFPNRVRVYSVPFALQAQEVVAVDASRVGSGMVDNTELDALDGVTGNVQQQIDAIDTAAVMQHTTDIAANTSAIATNTTDIMANGSAIATNTTDIMTNATAIALKGDASAVTQNATDIGTNATAIAANSTAISGKANSADVYTQTAANTAFVDASGDTMTGTLGVNTITEATADAGVTAEGLTLKDSYLGLPQITAPGDTTGKLYNVAGALFFGATQLGLSSLDKDGINNAGTLGFDWADSEIADGLTIQGGTVNNDSFSAFSDLTAESKIGTGATQVAAGNHAHAFSAITGSVTDAQVPDTISINGGTVNNNSFSALSDLNAESAIGTSAMQVAAGNHAHAFSVITGSVTDAQVPNDITITGMSAADDTAGAPAITYGSDTNTGIHRPGADQLAMVTNGAARLTVDNTEVNIAGNILEIASGSAPGTTTNKLYNTSGNLFWNGAQLNGGGGSTAEVFRYFTTSTLAELVSSSANQGLNQKHDGTPTPRYAQFVNDPATRVATKIEVYINEYETYTGTRTVNITAAIRDIVTGTVAHTVTTSTLEAVAATNIAWHTLSISGVLADRTIEPTEFLSIEVALGGADGGAGEMDLSFRLTLE